MHNVNEKVCEVIPLNCLSFNLYGIRALFSQTSSTLIFFFSSFASAMASSASSPVAINAIYSKLRSNSHQQTIPLGMHSLSPSFSTITYMVTLMVHSHAPCPQIMMQHLLLPPRSGFDRTN